MLTPYATILGFLLVAWGFVFASLVAGKILRPRPRAPSQAPKMTTYESGEKPLGPAWFNFNPRFYLAALVFLVFDVEIALIYPAVVVFRRLARDGHGLRAFVELFSFVGILLFGLAYAWKNGDLDWVRDVRDVNAARPAGPALPVAKSAAGTTVNELP